MKSCRQCLRACPGLACDSNAILEIADEDLEPPENPESETNRFHDSANMNEIAAVATPTLSTALRQRQGLWSAIAV